MKILGQYILGLILILATTNVCAQDAKIWGKISSDGHSLKNISIELKNSDLTTTSDDSGNYEFTGLPAGDYVLSITDILYKPYQKAITISENETLKIDISLDEVDNSNMSLNDVVISGTMKPVTKDKSPVPVEVYSKTYFKKNPTPNLFYALQLVNGVRPQVNCNVCNTGDIEINGLEGPYTMVLIDGMPIVSSLGTVYGFAGIPNSLIERVEVVKGPASSLYGSEAIGGLINIITKKTENADKLSLDVMATTWQEYNVDLGSKLNIGKNVDVLTGINYFNYQKIFDKNHDNFTDVTQQHRISAFQKWNFRRPENRVFTIAGRYVYEDRWGGDVRWERKYRGGDEIYGESIYTNRAELLGTYQLPTVEKMFFNFSLINHDQDSRYGNTSYIANQKIAFGQLTWDKKVGVHDLLAGAALRYTYYDDNTPGTKTATGENSPERTWLPGIFIQDEITLAPKHNLLLGARYDHNNYHGSIFTPRIAYKWSASDDDIIRLNAGTGFRVVNLFTEDHAALDGSREVVIGEKGELRPEKSYNVNLNYVKKIHFDEAHLTLDGSVYYTYFDNKIEGDFETDDNKIIYDNIDGHAISQGANLSIDLAFHNGLSFMLAGTYMDNTITNNGVKEIPEYSGKFTGTWTASYKIKPLNLTIDYTGNVYSPLKLPLNSDLDPRSPESPWWSLQNIQLTYTGLKDFEIYGGVKNLLDFNPADKAPFVISRTEDPFDKNVVKDANDQIVPSPNNPYGLGFDTTYVYAPNQGIRGFLGIRYRFN